MTQTYGYSSVVDMIDCDPATFTRENIERFLVALCDEIDMEREDLHFWDYEGDPRGYAAAPAHLRGVSAVQFIKTSSIVIHSLNDLQAAFIDLFSCKKYDQDAVIKVAEVYFRGRVMSCHTFSRGC